MNEAEHLKSMWQPKARRSIELIAPVCVENNKSVLNNNHWCYKVHFAFREALDIRIEERKKEKKPYLVWTQGPIISFKEGDLIHSNDGYHSVQVKFAQPMGWDGARHEMYEGVVTYSLYSNSNGKISEVAQESCSQMQFLEILIKGS